MPLDVSLQRESREIDSSCAEIVEVEGNPQIGVGTSFKQLHAEPHFLPHDLQLIGHYQLQILRELMHSDHRTIFSELTPIEVLPEAPTRNADIQSLIGLSNQVYNGLNHPVDLENIIVEWPIVV
jgi:hypothetical protein